MTSPTITIKLRKECTGVVFLMATDKSGKKEFRYEIRRDANRGGSRFTLCAIGRAPLQIVGSFATVDELLGEVLKQWRIADWLA